MLGLSTVARAGDSCGGCPSEEKEGKDSKESTKTRPCVCGAGFFIGRICPGLCSSRFSLIL
ncbi:MAG: hypothetical protein EBS49_06950 [Verrucomicrobia bacterium]|nr:hypothetical protein [Verrucomicrobiota bacterium]